MLVGGGGVKVDIDKIHPWQFHVGRILKILTFLIAKFEKYELTNETEE